MAGKARLIWDAHAAHLFPTKFRKLRFARTPVKRGAASDARSRGGGRTLSALLGGALHLHHLDVPPLAVFPATLLDRLPPPSKAAA